MTIFSSDCFIASDEIIFTSTPADEARARAPQMLQVKLKKLFLKSTLLYLILHYNRQKYWRSPFNSKQSKDSFNKLVKVCTDDTFKI